MRWFWIDRFVEFRPGQYARAVRNVSRAEEYLRDHFPGYPVMPGTLIIEGMAQTGGILAAHANGFRKMVVLAKLTRVEFTGTAGPGDQLVYEAELKELREEGSAVQCRASVNGHPLAEAEIVFGHLDRSQATQATLESYTRYRKQWLATLGVPEVS